MCPSPLLSGVAGTAAELRTIVQDNIQRVAGIRTLSDWHPAVAVLAAPTDRGAWGLFLPARVTSVSSPSGTRQLSLVATVHWLAQVGYEGSSHRRRALARSRLHRLLRAKKLFLPFAARSSVPNGRHIPEPPPNHSLQRTTPECSWPPAPESRSLVPR